jgi:hypothetical protein
VHYSEFNVSSTKDNIEQNKVLYDFSLMINKTHNKSLEQSP